MFLTEVHSASGAKIGRPTVPTLRLPAADASATGRVSSRATPADVTYSLSSRAGAVASRSPAQPRSHILVTPAPPVAPAPDQSARSNAASRARSRMSQTSRSENRVVSPARPTRPPHAAPYNLGDDDFESSDDEYFDDAVMACLPDAARPNLEPTIDLALRGRPKLVDPSHSAIGVLTARENARLNEIYQARADAMERDRLREWTRLVELSASAANVSAGSKKFDKTVAKIKQALNEAKEDQGSVELPEGEVKSGHLEKGDFRLYKAMIKDGRSEFRIEIKRDGHAQLFVSPTNPAPNSMDYVIKSVDPSERLLTMNSSHPNFMSDCWMYVSVHALTSVDYRLRVTTDSSPGAADSSKVETGHQHMSLMKRQTQAAEKAMVANDDEEDGGRKMRATDLAEKMKAQLRLLKEDAYARQQLEDRVRRSLAERRAIRAERAATMARAATANMEARGVVSDPSASGHDLTSLLEKAQGDFTARNKMPESYAPSAVERRRAAWQSIHAAKLERVVLQREQIESRFDELLATEKERQDAEGAAIAERRLKERNRVKSEGLQKRWLLWLAFLQRTHCLVSRVRGHQDEIAQQQKELAAAQVLFRVLRRVAERARRKRLRSAITAARTMLRICAHNYVCIQADKAADILVAFMGQMTGSRSLSHIVGNFRKKTVRSQKLMRQFLSIHGAKLRVWERQWVQVERQILFEEYSPKDAEPDEIEYDPQDPFQVPAPSGSGKSERTLATTRLVISVANRQVALRTLMDEQMAVAVRRLAEFREKTIDYSRQRQVEEMSLRYMGSSTACFVRDKLQPPVLTPIPTLLPLSFLDPVVRQALINRDSSRAANKAALADIARREAEIEQELMKSKPTLLKGGKR